MKKSFFIGLLLVSVVLGFAGCKQPVNGPVVTEKRFVATARADSSLSIDFSEIYEDGKFAGRVIMNKITYGDEVFNINKYCTWGKSNTIFNEIKDKSDVLLHKYDWTNKGKMVWSVDCSDINYKLQDGTFVTDIEFGPCNCSCNDKQHYVINVITRKSKEDSNYSGWAYFTDLEEVKHFIATTKEGLSIDFTARYQGENNPVKVILNKISNGNKVYEINKDCTWKESFTNYPDGDYEISGKSVQNLKWENGKAWDEICYEKDKPEIKIGDDTLAEINFGWCTCSIDNKVERIFVIDTKTYLADTTNGFVGCKSYIANPKTIK